MAAVLLGPAAPILSWLAGFRFSFLHDDDAEAEARSRVALTPKQRVPDFYTILPSYFFKSSTIALVFVRILCRNCKDFYFGCNNFPSGSFSQIFQPSSIRSKAFHSAAQQRTSLVISSSNFSLLQQQQQQSRCCIQSVILPHSLHLLILAMLPHGILRWMPKKCTELDQVSPLHCIVPREFDSGPCGTPHKHTVSVVDIFLIIILGRLRGRYLRACSESVRP